MTDPEAFIDTNVLLYLLSEDTKKADQAEKILKSGAIISVQVLNEVANVALRKLSMTWMEINEFVELIQSVCSVEPLTIETHIQGRFIAERYNVSIYDAMILSAALLAGCVTLYSEDMHHDLLVESRLRIRNPFKFHSGNL